VNNQRKILSNLQSRKGMLQEDSNKLYEEFRHTIDRDDQRGQFMKRMNGGRMSEFDILDC